MKFSVGIQSHRILCLCLLVGLGRILFVPLHGAESIRFSSGSSKLELPATGSTNQQIERLYQSIEKSPSSGLDMLYSTPSSPVSGPIYSRRLQDLIDQRKNWIFVTPHMAKDNMGSKMSGSQFEDAEPTEDANGTPGKTKTTVERYWSNQSQKTESPGRSKRESSNADNEFTSSLQPASSLNPSSKRLSNSRIGMESPNRFMEMPGTKNPLGLAPNTEGLLPGMRDPLSSGGWGGLFRNAGDQSLLLQKQTREDVRQMLRPDQTGTLLSGPNDPINKFPDLTSRDVQPITARAYEDYGSENGKQNAFGRLSSEESAGLGTAPNFLRESIERSSSQSSLTPVVTAPSSQNWMQQPSILEIPKRKF